MTVRIMTVCTGDICRSPYAGRVLADAFEAVSPGAFEVECVGIGALVGAGVDPRSVLMLARRGLEHDGFRARQISEPLLEGVDLVLPLTLEHRKIVPSYSPRLMKRCFTLKEAAGLIRFAKQRTPWGERDAGTASPEERWAQVIPAELVRSVAC